MVFAIPELLKQILLHSDTYALLRLQRINRRWKEVIAGTPSLRKVMLLEYSATADAQVELNTMISDGAGKDLSAAVPQRRLLGWNFIAFDFITAGVCVTALRRRRVNLTFIVVDSEDCQCAWIRRPDKRPLPVQQEMGSWREMKMLNRPLPVQVHRFGFGGSVVHHLSAGATLGCLVHCLSEDVEKESAGDPERQRWAEGGNGKQAEQDLGCAVARQSRRKQRKRSGWVLHWCRCM
ncbi:hypothetical protein LTR36_006665 [Oleoguttula mirabilis]|uniref:F-box domain-containing protein n=1 Tax=Oleoguttula mirabilis TaxID=1507867 RepID=A0AAV9JCF9_9PEZI|nr:hypothetical protein LTR36_006665 [Oleoguttula mirabilis]